MACIREGKKEDYEDILGLYRLLDEHHLTRLPSVFQSVVPETIRPEDFFLRVLSEESSCLFVAIENDSIIGFVRATDAPAQVGPVLKSRKIAVLLDIFVSNSFRNQGIGDALYERVLSWARSRGNDFLQLTVYSINSEAISFYEKRGMKPLYLTYEAPI